MAQDDRPTIPDPDDWFSEPDVSEALREQPTATPAAEATQVDDWLDASAVTAPRRRRRGGGGSGVNIKVAVIIGAILIGLLLLGLALGGVFSGSGSSGQPPLFTISTQTATTSTTTTKTSTTSTSAAAPTTTLKPGDTGHQVKVLQLALAHLGFSPGTIDGQYGAGTTQAVKNFQTAHGLTADGVCGPQTIAALKTALS
jgi:Putative peptidoglycan binding domain